MTQRRDLAADAAHAKLHAAPPPLGDPVVFYEQAADVSAWHTALTTRVYAGGDRQLFVPDTGASLRCAPFDADVPVDDQARVFAPITDPIPGTVLVVALPDEGEAADGEDEGGAS